MSWFRDIVDIIITRNPYFCHWQLTSQHTRCWKSFVMSLHSMDTDLHRHWCNQLKDLGWTSIIGFRSLFLIEPKQRPLYAISVVKYSNRQLFVSKGRLTIYFVSSKPHFSRFVYSKIMTQVLSCETNAKKMTE